MINPWATGFKFVSLSHVRKEKVGGLTNNKRKRGKLQFVTKV